MYRDVWTIHFSHVSCFVLSGALIIFSVYLLLNIALDIKKYLRWHLVNTYYDTSSDPHPRVMHADLVRTPWERR